ncbi:STN domain-containing protein [Bacteroidales bacterium OttesenSCG-928-K03]|nr:STN domain-containing protein [Bacteroidales bacterium OttesenSCG-928-K03]
MCKLIILLFFLLISPIANISAQQINSEPKITLNENGKSVNQILNIVATKTGLKFSYNPQIIDENKIININVSNANIEEVINQIFDGKICHKIIGNHIILIERVIENNFEEDIIVAKDIVETKNSIKSSACLTGGQEVTNLNQPATYNNQATSSHSNPVTSSIRHSVTQKKIAENVTITRETYLPIKKIDYKSTGKLELDCLTHVTKINEKDMKKHVMTLLLASVIFTDTMIAQEIVKNENVSSAKSTTKSTTQSTENIYKPINFYLVYPLGTDWVHSASNEYSFSLSLIGGVTGKTNGAEIAPVFNINRYGVKGLQMAAGFNLASASSCICDGVQQNELVEESKVVQMAAIFNYTGYGKATQFAAGFNIAKDATIQVSAVGNIANNTSAQLAAGINVAQNGKMQVSAVSNIVKYSSPVQLTAGINYAKNNKVQISALTNIADSTKFQMTAALNIAKTSKAQIGVVNVTKKGKFQLGVVNVRDTADGFSLGLINIAKGGVMEFGIEGGEFITGAVTFRSGRRYLYTVLSAGWNSSFGLRSDDGSKSWGNDMLATGWGLGSTIRLGEKSDLNLEVMCYNLIHVNSDKYDNLSGLRIHYPEVYFFQFRPYFNYTFHKHFKMFVGPTFNLMYQKYEDVHDLRVHRWLITPYSIVSKESNIHDRKIDFWIGGTLGFKF